MGYNTDMIAPQKFPETLISGSRGDKLCTLFVHFVLMVFEISHCQVQDSRLAFGLSQYGYFFVLMKVYFSTKELKKNKKE